MATLEKKKKKRVVGAGGGATAHGQSSHCGAWSGHSIPPHCESGEASDDKAYKASEKKKRQPKSSNTEKECSYCKKHYPQGRYTGHTWNECNKLKRDRESKTKDSDKDEQAKVMSDNTLSEAVSLHTSATPLRSTKWIFDTAASSHMTNTPDTLLNRQTQTGNVRLGDDSSIPVEGKGTVNLMGVIPGGTASPIVLENVLYVPSLGNANLFSWCAAQRSGSFYLEGTRDDILIRKGNANGKIVLWAKLEGLDYVIQTVTESAKTHY